MINLAQDQLPLMINLSTLVDTLDGVEEPLVSILVPGLPVRRVSGTFA